MRLRLRPRQPELFEFFTRRGPQRRAGRGRDRRFSAVRWGTAGDILGASFLTFPAAGWSEPSSRGRRWR
ncbi:MAG TPA: hypothetical protein VFG15_23695 [Amycolatopsis sp.]|nr:hypothetical protein [Amycolatopsis sp.]